MTAKEALESIILRAKEDRNKEQQKYIESNYELVKQTLEELEAIKSTDGGEAMNMLNKISNETYLETYYDEDSYSETEEYNVFSKEDERLEYLKNFILKSQALKEDRDYWKNEYNFLFPLYSDANAKNFKLEQELAELKECITLFNKFNSTCVSKKGLNEEEYYRYKELSKKYNMYLYGVCKGSEE